MLARFVIICLLGTSSLCHAQSASPKPASASASAGTNLRTRTDAYPQAVQINFAQNSTVWTIASELNVREQADPKAKIVAKLPIGTEVLVLSKAEAEPDMTQNGISAKWLRGRFTLAGEKKEGYLWSGLLTAVRIKSVAEDGTYFFIGMQAIKPDAGGGKMINQIRAANGGTELARLSFAAPNAPGFTFSGASEGAQGLAGVNDVLMLNFLPEACGLSYGETIVFWTGTNFILGETADKFSDPPVYAKADWILPGEPGGVKGQILWKQEAGDYGEDGKAPQISSKASAVWVWNGSGMQKK